MKNFLISYLILILSSSVSWGATQTPAKDITVNTSSFSKNLNSTDSTVQAALNTLDQVQGSAGSGGNWGDIGGVLSHQTDLWSALNGKQGTITTGTIYQYFRGDLSLATFPTNLNQFTNGPGYITGANWNQIGGIQSSVNVSGFYNDGVYLNAATWAAISKIVQDKNINWSSIQDIAGSNINWATVNQIMGSNINWSNFLLPNGNINWTGALIPNSAINWPGLTIINGTGINWAQFYQASNPAGYLNAVPWGSGTVINMTGINWNYFYPTSNPLGFQTSSNVLSLISSALSGYATQAWVAAQGFLTSINWAGGNTSNMTGINWSDHDLLSAIQTVQGTKTFANTILGNISGNAATATNMPYAGLTGTVPTWNQSTTGNAATVTTNANLTGPIASVGNATAITSQTGTGTTFVMSTSPTITSPTLITPNLGAAVGTTLNITSLTASSPVVTDSSNKLSSGTSSGNTTKFVTTTSASTIGDCVKIDAYGNHVDAGSACGVSSPGGSTNQIQVNSVGSFTGYSNFIFDGNNQGIGTASPGTTLDVNGTIRSTNFIDTGVTASSMVKTTSGKQLVAATVGTDYAPATTGSSILYANAGGFGNVGIGSYLTFSGGVLSASGTTATPGGTSPQLEYNNGGSFGGIANTGSDGTNVGIGTPIPTASLTVQKNGYNDYVRVDSFSQAKGNIFLIQNSGNVGVGTINPQNVLAVGGTASIGSAYATVGAPTNGLIVEGNVGIGTTVPSSALSVGSEGVSIGTSYTNGISAPTNGLAVLGNVGIGVISPTAKEEILATTEQLRLDYDATHYASMIVDSTGGLTIGGTTGLLTAAGFSGPLTGNVTGNVSGSSGSTTGNAATATNLSTNGTANQVWGMNAGASAQGWQTEGTGTVTSVAALTIGTTGTDLSSTVANGTTTPVITLQVPTASSLNRGALSSTDWSTFNGKQPSLSVLKGTLTDTDVCTYTASGTLLNCNTPTSTWLASGGTAANSLELGGALPAAYALVGQTMHIGTTSTAINRSSAAQALTGITSIDNDVTGVTVSTTTTDKVGFFGASPVVQQTGNVCTALNNLGLTTSCSESTLSPNFSAITAGTNTAALHVGTGGSLDATGTGTIAATTATTAGNLSGTPALPNGTKGTTQAAGDNSTKLATTAYVGMTLACSASPSGASSFTLTNGSGGCTIAAGNRYELVLNLLQNTTNGVQYIQFNTDTGNNYHWAGYRMSSSGGSAESGADSVSQIQLISSNSVATYSSTLYVSFQTIQGDSHSVSVSETGQYYDGNYLAIILSGIYVGSANLSSVTIGTTAGTITGTATLYQLN
jgi:hypothetical protein